MDRLALKDVLARMWRHAEDISPRKPAPAGSSVLVVDDARTIVRALSLMLERAGYRTIAAVDGVQAVALARRHRPDLILMDIVMPLMNGFEATRILRHDPATKDIPIVIISGTNLPSDQAWSARLGAKGFLAKPIGREALLTKVGAVLAESHAAQTRPPLRNLPSAANTPYIQGDQPNI